MPKLLTLSEPEYEQLFGPLTGAQTVASIDYSLARFKALGAPPPLDSRLHRARETIHRAGAKPDLLRRSAKHRRLLAEAHRTAVEFYAIARSLNPRAVPIPKAIRRKLVLSYGGAEDPAKDTDRTIVARNSQFELWVAAWLTAGGKPVRMAEPDLQIAFRFEWYGLAAKRVRSPAQILKRVREAANQVKKNTGSGFVALALDNYSLARRIRTQSDLAAGARLFASYPQVEEAAQYLMTYGPHIKGLLCFGHYARWQRGEDPPSLQMSNLTRIYLLPSDTSDAEYLNAYVQEHGTAFREAWRKL